MSTGVVEPKPGVDVGRVVVDVLVENLSDLDRVASGDLRQQDVRRVELEALVDSGATLLCLPEPVIQKLGLMLDRERQASTANGIVTARIYRGARITVQDRSCTVEVMALQNSPQALLGQIPLETLDWWIDLTHRRLVGNPEHGGQWMAEAF